jgi:hypothetical protein
MRTEFPILNPNEPLPPGVIFVEDELELPHALRRVSAKEADVAIWRMPWRPELIEACQTIHLDALYRHMSGKPNMTGAYWSFGTEQSCSLRIL